MWDYEIKGSFVCVRLTEVLISVFLHGVFEYLANPLETFHIEYNFYCLLFALSLFTLTLPPLLHVAA